MEKYGKIVMICGVGDDGMINFIIYEDEQKMREWYISIILKIVGRQNNAYRIIEIDRYDSKTMKRIKEACGKKIFILDIEVPGKSGLDLAREIRMGGDWLSQMIVVTSHDKMVNWSFRGKMLMLDFISKYSECEENLAEAIKLAYQILTTHKSMTFQLNGELYQVPYQDILYIEKNLDEVTSTIYTKESELEIKQGITSIMEFLQEDPRFMKTHRSCIVNLFNITSVDLVNNIIYFDHKSTPLLSRDKKKELKERISDNSVRV